jgi:hypothetical protein
MLIRKIATGACLSVALLFAAGTQASANPLASSAFSHTSQAQTTVGTAPVIQVESFGFSFGLSDRRDYRRGRDYRRDSRHRGNRYHRRSRGPSFSLTIPVPSRRYSDSGSCSHWSQQCTNSWGYGNNNYSGCMRYYGC